MAATRCHYVRCVNPRAAAASALQTTPPPPLPPGPLPQLWRRLAGSPSLVALAAMVALPLGLLMPMLMLWNLALTGLLLWQTHRAPLAADKA